MNAFDTLHNVVFGHTINAEDDDSLVRLAGELLMEWLKDENHDQSKRPQMSEEFMDCIAIDCDPDAAEQRFESLGIDELSKPEQKWLNSFREEFEREMWEAEQDEKYMWAEARRDIYLSLRGR